MISTDNIIGNTLTWLTVKDLEAAITFYTEVLGYTVQCQTPEYGWAELKAPEGAVIGLGQENPTAPFKAGSNAVVTIEVRDIEAAKKELLDKKAVLHGDIEEIPDHVKMLTFEDRDGNTLQLAQKLG